MIALVFPALVSAQSYMRGVNVSGAEFGENSIPGTFNRDYTYNSAQTFAYFAARSLPFIRLQIRWERLQPTPHGPLDQTNLGYLKQDVAWAKAAGAQISIEAHNYGRYKINENGKLNEYILDNQYGGAVKVTGDDLADFWTKMSAEFKDEPAVIAYDMMNEPHDMGSANWNAISQKVVTAVRNNGDNKLIMVPGNQWSNATAWASLNGSTGWISDPANNFLYEAHEYFDRDYSGTYAWPYDQELAANLDLANVGVNRLAPFVSWCQTNNVRCYLGEYGIPNNDPRWLTVLDRTLAKLDEAGFSGTYWAAGEWWNDYPLSVEPANNFTTDREQMPTLLSHIAPASFTSVSSAAVFGYMVAQGQYVAGYGKNLAAAPKSATELPYPLELDGTSVQLTDSTGATTKAPLVFISPGQINYQLPDSTPAGRVDVKVINNGSTLATGVLQVVNLAPTLFSADSSGTGVAAAQITRVKADGTQTVENVAVYSNAQGKFLAAPIDFAGDRLVLVLYGTGIRNGSGISGANLKVGNSTIPVQYVGKQGQYPGLDQVNARLPTSLAGAGQVDVVFAMDGHFANTVTLTFK